MTWIIDEGRNQYELAEEFSTLIKGDKLLKIPGTHDSMAALIAKKTGFKSLYLSGAAYTASRGLPDLGIINSKELSEYARDIVRSVNLPLLVDIDTGFGGIINVARTVREMFEARVAAVQIEDQESPKKCGHLNGKKLISPEEMCEKIQVIKEVTPSMVIVARTDAASIEGLDRAIERAHLYLDAGADAIFTEALTSKEEFNLAGKAINAPLLANLTEFGKTPYFTADEIASFGYKMALYPVTSLRVAAKAYENVFTEIQKKGTQQGLLDEMQTRAELYDTIKYFEYEKLDNKIAKTVLNHNMD